MYLRVLNGGSAWSTRLLDAGLALLPCTGWRTTPGLDDDGGRVPAPVLVFPDVLDDGLVRPEPPPCFDCDICSLLRLM
jgi:hypothetical protein